MEGCSFNINSILETGLIVGGRESKEGRRTIFFTPLNLFGDNPDEEAPSDDLSVPRRVHYHNNWKHTQDAVHWINLFRAQDQGLRFEQTKSNAIVAHNPVPVDCIYKIISLFERLSTPRPAPRVTLRSCRSRSSNTLRVFHPAS